MNVSKVRDKSSVENNFILQLEDDLRATRNCFESIVVNRLQAVEWGVSNSERATWRRSRLKPFRFYSVANLQPELTLIFDIKI